jgi:hypothetical protein
MRKRWFAILSLVLAAAIADAQTFKVLYNFGSKSGDPTNPFSANMVQGRDGNMVSTSYVGGINHGGAFYELTPSGEFRKIFSFGAQVYPVGGLTLGTDGVLYGAALSGLLFKISGGTLTTLHVFTGGEDGLYPGSAPIEGIDGNFYGTTTRGGGGANGGYGTVYKFTRSGTYEKLRGLPVDDQYPEDPLVQARDGMLYGVSSSAIFRVTLQGDLERDVAFLGVYGLIAPLVQGEDGDFYSTTARGGIGWGSVFKVTPTGVVTQLHSFTGPQGDGDYPIGTLVQAPDGDFYGTTAGNNSLVDCGTIFRTSSSGTYTKLFTFPSGGALGCNPASTLLQHTNGIFYGSTEDGGSAPYGGVLFSLDVGLPPFVRLLPEASRVGQTVGIFGQGFTGTTAVNFNGTPASFTVVSDTYLTAPVPSGATTGVVTVTTPSGTLTSNKKFQVRPQVTSFSPASGPVGTTVVITGVSLGGATRVTFDGVDTTFTQNSGTQVTATVPSGALTGHVGVTTTGAASYGHDAFTVTP